MGAVHRYGGDTRYETAGEVASQTVRALGGRFDGTAFLATGRTFADALGAAPMCASNGWPLYLNPSGQPLRADVKAAMAAQGVKDVVILGDGVAISSGAEDELKAMLGDSHVTRVQGRTRYETGAALADFALTKGGMTAARISVATGENYPDALAGGPLQGRAYSICLLVKRNELPAATSATLGALRDRIYQVRFLGSTKTISSGVRSAVAGRLR
jgi:putative cell wall-binding protein